MIYVENIAIMIVGYTTFSSHQISFRLRYTLCSDKTQTVPLSDVGSRGDGELNHNTSGAHFSPLLFLNLN